MLAAMLVRRANMSDLDEIATIHHLSFPRQMQSKEWVSASLSAAPRITAYVLMHENAVAGYIFWVQKSGIRPSAVLELDQIAVLPEYRKRGLGEHLIRRSLSMLGGTLTANGQSVKSILVSTRADNNAQKLYEKVLGTKVVASIDNLYSATEVLMLAESPVL
jgi:ribosomal protein S18 acetylase RimI-like enzyme